MAIGLPALLVVLVLWVMLTSRGLRNVPIVCTGAFLLLALLVWFGTRFRKECTYVGQDGLVRLTCKENRENITKELFLYRDAVELRTGEVALYQNAVYQGTKYEFRWLDTSGAKVFVHADVYFEPGRSYTKRPKRNPGREFALAAESAWTRHLQARAKEQLKQEGRISFRVGKDDWVEVGRDFLEFHFQGQSERCSVQEIGGLDIDKGSCRVTARDGRSDGLWKRGAFEFPLGDMSNSLLFCRVCDKLLGSRLVSK